MADTTVIGYVPVNKAGDTMTGDLILNADPTNALGAVTKQYADAIGSGVDSIAGNTGAFTLSSGITNTGNDIRVDAGNVPGVANNSNAGAGIVGEFISSNVLSGSAISLTNATASNVTSISLTAGDWDVSGMVALQADATTSISLVCGYISNVSATLPTTPNNTAPMGGGGINFIRMDPFVIGGTANPDSFILPTGTVRVSLNATTTIYLGAYCAFTVSTMVAYGYIGARRVR